MCVFLVLCGAVNYDHEPNICFDEYCPNSKPTVIYAWLRGHMGSVYVTQGCYRLWALVRDGRFHGSLVLEYGGHGSVNN